MKLCKERHFQRFHFYIESLFQVKVWHMLLPRGAKKYQTVVLEVFLVICVSLFRVAVLLSQSCCFFKIRNKLFWLEFDFAVMKLDSISYDDFRCSVFRSS